MMPLIVVAWLMFGVAAALALLFIVTFVRERERRAVVVTVIGSTLVLGPFAALLLVDFGGRDRIVLGLLIAVVVVFGAIVLITTRNERVEVTGSTERVDERDAVFHRFYRIEPGSPEWEAYYRSHPEKLSFDDRVRARPPLAGPGSKSYHRLSSPMQIACFDICEEISRELEWRPRPIEKGGPEVSPEEMSARIKGFARYLGAVDVGCTVLDPAWVYSHVGRAPGEWGAPIELDHTHAVAIAVAMRHDMVRLAPDSPTTTETAFEYLEAAKIAMVIARYINFLGYEARAHVDANYRVLCIPIAVDAGLGELGRLGLLINPKHGPRVRLSVVTTDLPLATDPPIAFGVQHFCTICRKCAEVCPSRAVDRGDKREINGAVKWQSEQDSCYRYWRTVGSDCALCMKICPYAHPVNPAHDMVRWAITRNPLARRLALWADDLAYGRKPSTGYPYPEWHRSN
jgi:ferredoxin